MKFIIGLMFTIFLSLTVIGQTGNNLVTRYSVGDVKLGMTIGEARQVLPKGLRLGPAAGGEGSTLVGVYEDKKLLFTVGYYEDDSLNEKQKIDVMLIMDSRFKTVEGVHVGMPIAEAETKYGKLKEMFNYPHEGEFGSFTNQPEYLKFFFKPKGKFSEAGIYYEEGPIDQNAPECPEDAYPPSCRVAKRYNSGSYIFEMAVKAPQPIQKTIKINDVPKDYKATIYGPSNCEGNEEERKTTYYISWKVPLKNGGYSLPHQQFHFEGLLPCPEMGYGEDSKNVSYKDQWDVVLDDFNFDGMTDLALRDGNNGGYGFPSYQVYLFSKADSKFVLNPSFTELGQYQGMFEVKANRKMIYNHTKSGCCSHTTEGYTIVNNKPFKVYDHTVEGAIEVSDGVTTPEVITKKLINGKWRTWNINSASRIYFDRGKSSKTLSVKLNRNEPIKWFKLGAAEGQIMNVSTDSADADIKLVDFRGNVGFYDSNESINEGVEFPVKLNAKGDYYLEISSEKTTTVNLTITIKNE